jgi:hypothetical protein
MYVRQWDRAWTACANFEDEHRIRACFQEDDKLTRRAPSDRGQRLALQPFHFRDNTFRAQIDELRQPQQILRVESVAPFADRMLELGWIDGTLQKACNHDEGRKRGIDLFLLWKICARLIRDGCLVRIKRQLVSPTQTVFCLSDLM